MTERTVESVVRQAATLALLLSLAGALVAGATGHAAAASGVDLSCVGSSGGAVYETDTGLTVYENDGDILYGNFPAGDTVDFGIDAVALSASGSAQARVDDGTGSQTCLGNVQASANAITVAPDGEANVVLQSDLNGFAYRDPDYAANTGADVAYDAPSSATVTFRSTGEADGTTIYAVDASSGTVLDQTTVSGGDVTFTLPSGTHDVDLRTNAAPTNSDSTVSTNEDTNHVFAASEFQFADPDTGDSLQSVEITSLPDTGTLFLDADGDDVNDGEAVAANQRIAVEEIADGKLQYAPPADQSGTGLASFGFVVSDGIAFASSASTMTVDVSGVNDAPTMSADARWLGSIGAGASDNGGSAVSAILGSAGTTDDVEGDPLGVAVTGVDDTDGTWEYSTDGGRSWQTVSSASPSAGSALLLAETDRVRFVPDGGFVGEAGGSITVRAWDQTSGTAGDTDADTTSNGGTTAYSSTTARATITVEDVTPPTVDLSVPATATAGTPVAMNAENASDDRNAAFMLRYDWTFGDGTTAGGPSVTHTYDEPGNYTVYLTVTDVSGNAVNVSATITVASASDVAPTADAGPNRTVDEDAPVTFDGSNSTADPGVANYTWEFGDGATATGVTATHTYTDPGTYTATLTVTDGDGNAATDTVTVTVRDVTPPTARVAANVSEVNVSEPVAFDASASTDEVGVRAISWDLDDDGRFDDATGESITTSFETAGEHAVSIRVTDRSGNAETATATVTAVANGTGDATSVEAAIAGADGRIQLPELQQAIRYWAMGEPVPGTDGRTLDVGRLQGLIRTWADGESVGST
jgi:PKD repeat protein